MNGKDEINQIKTKMEKEVEKKRSRRKRRKRRSKSKFYFSKLLFILCRWKDGKGKSK